MKAPEAVSIGHALARLWGWKHALLYKVLVNGCVTFQKKLLSGELNREFSQHINGLLTQAAARVLQRQTAQVQTPVPPLPSSMNME